MRKGYFVRGIVLSYLWFNFLYPQKIFLISIPKCGTHLLAELIKLLTNKEYQSVGTYGGYSISGSDVETIESRLRNLKDNMFLLGHTTYNPSLAKKLKKSNIATFFKRGERGIDRSYLLL